MTSTITHLRAHEILDSRGNPTLSVSANLSDGTTAEAQVPSGASTGKHEALELRDGNPARYNGKGVLRAASHVNNELNLLVRGASVEDLAAIDATLIPLKTRYGANAVLGVSCALARALAKSRGEPLWRTLASVYKTEPSVPNPMVNILSGGLHANRNIEFQDFLVIPQGYETYAEALHGIVDVHRAARDVIEKRGYTLTGVADEGGWGPLLPNNRTALEILTEAIELSKQNMTIALDVASTHFFEGDKYRLEGETLSSDEMIGKLAKLTQDFPVTSIEDGLSEDDWEGWRKLTARLDRIQLVGDDFFTTNSERVQKGIQSKSANAVLVKMNQIGTLKETFDVLKLAKDNGYRCVVSARSGETEDSFLADLATASGCGQIKVGSITRSERLAKYNRLLEIESFELTRAS